MRKKHQYIIWIIAFSLLISTFDGMMPIFGADIKSIQMDTYNINTIEDFEAFVANCTLDTWSQGKVVSLNSDLDISSINFEGIPTFGGVFEGNDHTITGLNIIHNGSVQGLFRYVQKDAIIKDLTVKGNVTPIGTQKYVGGIAGKNAGTIKDCIFAGAVDGESYIGGIVGLNEVTGQVMNSVAFGLTSGKHYTGGIVGGNLGTILESKNKMSVNIAVEERDLDLEALKDINLENINSTENTSMITDTGGVAGFSTGIIQGCRNYGKVGYQHIGYNVGGIVGRQSGYIYNCNNLGTVYGRKDVGGIVGQMEPYIALEFSEDKIAHFQTELDKLKVLTDEMIACAGDYSSDVTAQLDKTKTHISTAIDTTEEIAVATEALYNEGVESINDLSARISETLDKLTPVIDQAGDMGDDIILVAEELEEVFDALEVTSDKGKKLIDALDDTAGTIKESGEGYQTAIKSLGNSFDKLQDALGDEEAIEEALKEINSALKDVSNAFESLHKSFDEIAKELDAIQQYLKDDADINQLIEGFLEIGGAFNEITTATNQIVKSVEQLIKAANIEETQAALISMQQALQDFSKGVGHLKVALEAIDPKDMANSDLITFETQITQANSEMQAGILAVETALTHLETAVSGEEAQKAQEELQQGLKDLANALTQVQVAQKKITGAMEGILKDVEGVDGASLEKILKNLNESLEDIAQAINKLQSGTGTLIDEVNIQQIKKAMDKLSSAVEALSDALEESEDVLDAVRDALKRANQTLKAADKITVEMKDVVNQMERVASQADNMVSDIHDIIKNLAEKPTIALPNLSSEYIENTNQLADDLTNISNGLGDLNNIVADHNEKLLDDIHALSDQFVVVIDTIVEIVESIGDEEEHTYTQDISDDDTENTTEGKVLGCTNEGPIEGDINVGGITGAMAIEYDFDLEDDVTKIGSDSFNFSYLTRAVVRDCMNKGNITAKKDYVGGIVGRMDLGTIMKSYGYGKIISTDGDYVGGVAGASYSHIKDSFAMCVLSGNTYIGGIAGYGSKLTHNYAMIEIEEALEAKGAIAGHVKEVNQQRENYFIDRGIAGIDSISYTGKAESITYGEMCQVEGMPEAFLILTLTFKVDGETLTIMPFNFGEGISREDLPQAPQKEGYYVKWPDIDYECLTFSTTLEAEYIPYQTVISSSLTREGKSVALIRGTFDEDATLNVIEKEIIGPEGERIIAWTVMLNEANYDETNRQELRLLANEDAHAKVYVLQEDGKWKVISGKKNGSYVVVDMEGTTGTYTIIYQKNRKYLIGLIILGMSLAVGSGIMIKKRRLRA